MTEPRDTLAAVVKALDDAHITHALKAGTAEFRVGIRTAIRGLWTGDLVRFAFVDSMTTSIQRGFRDAWLEGAATCGITSGELTTAERAALEQAINAEIPHLLGFADAIEAGSKENDGKLAPLFTRGDMWVNAFFRIRAQAQTMACADQKFKWVIDPAKDHCDDCKAQDGRVHRGSVWASAGVTTQSPNLACNGVRCGCRFVPTNDRATPGRPPRLSGG